MKYGIPGGFGNLTGRTSERAETMGSEQMNREKAESWLKIGLLANMIEGYFAIALDMPAWRPILGGLVGFVGICLEFPALMTIYPLIRETMPRGGSFYMLAMYVYLALGGGAVHLPCGAFMWIYKTVAEAAGQSVGQDIAMRYLLTFLLPAAAVFGVFFIGASVVQFIAFAKGRTPFPKWYCVFNLNTALCNGIGTSNMSLGAIVLYTALLLGWKKYVGDREYVL